MGGQPFFYHLLAVSFSAPETLPHAAPLQLNLFVANQAAMRVYCAP
jgi:hypothetical protein